MSDTNEKVLEIIIELKDKIGEIHQKTSDTNTEVKLVNQRMTALEDRVEDHHSILYGDPKKGGEGGMLAKIKDQDNKIDGIGRRLDSFRSFFVLIWTGIFAIIQIAFAVLRDFFTKPRSL